MKETKNIKILVLDDSQARLDIFQRNIKKGLDAATIYVKTARDAIGVLEVNKNFDYIFLDHDLGGLQMEWEEDNCGMNVVDWIIANDYNKEVRIIIHSWNIPRGQEMKNRLVDAGYSAIQHPGVWEVIGS